MRLPLCSTRTQQTGTPHSAGRRPRLHPRHQGRMSRAGDGYGSRRPDRRRAAIGRRPGAKTDWRPRMSNTVNHRKLAVGYFNAAWDLIDAGNRTPEQDRDMICIALASRQHWIEAGGADENLAVADWEVAHAACLAGFAELALSFAQAAVDRADSSEVPSWLKASTHEGLARAYAAAGDKTSYQREVAVAQALLETVT